MNSNNRLDTSLIFGVFTSSIILWFFLYSTIVDLTTEDPASLALLYLGLAHYLSFACIILSFIVMLNNGLQIGLEDHEYNRLKKFQKIAYKSKGILFSVWGIMFILSVTSLVSHSFFASFKTKFLMESGGLILGIIICISFFILLRINILRLIMKINPWVLITTPFLLTIYFITLSVFAADIKYKVEKEFYTINEIAHFEVKRKGYILLPQIKYVLYNFHDTLKEYSDGTYFIELNKDTSLKQSLVEITYSPQMLENDFRKYIYINKSPK
ncbi:hypothetical protein [Sediminibacterium sp.]|uniref:hypothetical protein n=1 Tax=Sediminibacterium sp. TaxID=1917865 RepID=UPI0025EB10B7|nr:hypothetical protein [Sediminibacterium sp.]MBW0179190.1 hypothetical protein [Sediminibacterium sp.]